MVNHFAVATLLPVPAAQINAIRRAVFGILLAALSQAASNAPPNWRQASCELSSEVDAGRDCWMIRVDAAPSPQLLRRSMVPDSAEVRRGLVDLAPRSAGAGAGA